MADHVVVIANDLRIIRESIGFALSDLRPEIKFIVVEPIQVLEAVLRRSPDLVILSNLDLVHSLGAKSWLLVPTDGGASFLVSFVDNSIELRRGGFLAIVATVDEAVRIGKKN